MCRLQTCVGKANYAQFFTVACTGALQFLTQVVFATVCLVWIDLPADATSESQLTLNGLLIACLFISIPCTLMYFILLGFHLSLWYLGYGTYDWMLRRRKKQRAKAAAAAAARKKSGGVVTLPNGESRADTPRCGSEATSESSSFRHLSSVGDSGSARVGELTVL